MWLKIFALISSISIALFLSCTLKCKSSTNTDNVIKMKSKKGWPMTIVIHGGAGTIYKNDMTHELEQKYHLKMQEALNHGYQMLQKGESSIDAVVSTIKILEQSPLFNAGRGAVYTYNEDIELDASIMDGKTGKAGAVAGVKHIRNPIEAAREIMNHSIHVLLSGKGAENFARLRNLSLVENSYFGTKKMLNQVRKAKEKKNNSIKLGTVGAVALDKFGNLAAGTSTGGMTNKRFGRIGDSPIIGAGTYADNKTCAVSSTGHGEYFIRNVVAYDIAAQMKYKNISLKEAVNHTIFKTLEPINGKGGVIALDTQGNIEMKFNTLGMYRGYINEKNKPKTFIYKNIK